MHAQINFVFLENIFRFIFEKSLQGVGFDFFSGDQNLRPNFSPSPGTNLVLFRIFDWCKVGKMERWRYEPRTFSYL